MSLVDHRDRSDAELLSLARRGSDAAFAVLVRRCVDDVSHALDGTPQLLDETTAVFRTAMQQLSDGAADNDVRQWFVELAESRASGSAEAAAADHTEDSPQVARATPEGSRHASEKVDVDAVWARLAPLWPHGRRRREPHPLAIWTVTGLVTIALSAGIPWLVLGQGPADTQVDELRAFPIQVAEPEPEIDEPEIDEPSLPVFEFPVPPEDLEEPDDASGPDVGETDPDDAADEGDDSEEESDAPDDDVDGTDSEPTDDSDATGDDGQAS